MGLDLAATLNEEQLAAATAPDGPVLVIAAAGTGKTRTLTCRVAHLMERGISPERILLLTFTNRAAKEMLERARQLAGPAVSGLWGGTFHHMGNRLLRRHASDIGYANDFTILDSDDAKKLVRTCVDELQLKSKSFPKPDVLLSLFSFANGTGKAVDDVAATRYKGHDVDFAAILKVYRLYEKKKKAINGMDFDDLLGHTLKLLQESQSIREYYQERFLHILVDEYQDTSVTQSAIVDILAAGNRNLLVVGDDFQSIYSWRGANYRNILSFPQRYADTRIFRLELNYRSAPAILDVANVCISGNPEQFQKKIRAVRSDKHRPWLVCLRDGGEQARFIVRYLRRLQDKKVALDDMAVLYRSHYHAMELQMELTREGIPYVITSGVRFFEQAHIKDVCALLRLVVNPADELAFRRLFELLPRLGEKSVLKVWNKLGQKFDGASQDTRDALLKSLPAAARPQGQILCELFAGYYDNGLAPKDLIELIVERFYDQYAVENFDNYERRLEDIKELGAFAARYESLESFLEEMALLVNMDAEEDNPQGEQKGVRLSTIHQAKGLEWKVVFVLWLAEGMFPSQRSLEDGEALAEERRLFYVAATRARDELILCVPEMHRDFQGVPQYYSPSRFVRELPNQLFEAVR